MSNTHADDNATIEVTVVQEDAIKVRWYVLAVIGGFALGIFHPATRYYFAGAVVTGAAAYLFYKISPARRNFLKVVAIGLAFSLFSSWNQNWSETLERDQNREAEEDRQEIKAVEKVMLVVYHNTFKVIDVNTYGPHVDFQTRDGGCVYRAPYIELDKPNGYGLIEGQEELKEVVPQLANDHAVQPDCAKHPLKQARESQPG